MIRRFWSLAIVCAFGALLAACGNTWEGAKKDSKENATAADKAIEDTVEDVKDAVN